jgi:hypothetical protein
MEVGVKARALGGAAMAGGGMWMRERGVARAAKRHGDTRVHPQIPHPSHEAHEKTDLTGQRKEKGEKEMRGAANRLSNSGTAYTNTMKKSHAG